MINVAEDAEDINFVGLAGCEIGAAGLVGTTAGFFETVEGSLIGVFLVSFVCGMVVGFSGS